MNSVTEGVMKALLVLTVVTRINVLRECVAVYWRNATDSMMCCARGQPLLAAPRQ